MKHVVVIVDEDDRSYYSHRLFDSYIEARGFSDGMTTAWEISHGPSNCWFPLILSNKTGYKEWVSYGKPRA